MELEEAEELQHILQQVREEQQQERIEQEQAEERRQERELEEEEEHIRGQELVVVAEEEQLGRILKKLQVRKQPEEGVVEHQPVELRHSHH